MTKKSPTPQKEVVSSWQKQFLDEGTANGLGDLSMMIGKVSQIINKAREKAYKDGLVDGVNIQIIGEENIL